MRHYYTHLHNLLSSQMCYSYQVEKCTKHQVGMYISASVGGMATVLPVVEHHVKSHYFLNQPCRYENINTFYK